MNLILPVIFHDVISVFAINIGFKKIDCELSYIRNMDLGIYLIAGVNIYALLMALDNRLPVTNATTLSAVAGTRL